MKRDGEKPKAGAVRIPIEGELDLHTFDPGELGVLLPEYIHACRERGLLEIRIVHGKGSGTLGRSVHALLERLPEVESFHLAGAQSFGGWGATFVKLRPLQSPNDEEAAMRPKGT